MTELWVRQINSDLELPHYRWYASESGEHGNCPLPELARRWPEASLTLLVSGVDCPSRCLAFNPEEKRHLARLMPYELETDLAQDINGLHVALGLPAQREAPEVIVSYMDKRALAARIEVLEGAGFDVRHCYAEPLLLPASAESWLLRWSGEHVDISWGAGRAASIDLSMLGVFLDSLLQTSSAAQALAPHSLRLQALTAEGLETLHAHVSASDLIQATQPRIMTVQLENIWQGVVDAGQNAGGKSGKLAASMPDLRQGAFSRPVRWQKFWRPARLPVMAAALAALTFAAVTVIETQLNNQRFRSLQQDIESTYREVVPGGMLVDAEQQLRAQLGQLRGGASDGSVLAMLNKITPHISQNTQLSINRLSYSGSSTATAMGELQLSVEAASNTDILQFAEQLGNSGLQARAQNITQAGNRQQASMIITEITP